MMLKLLSAFKSFFTNVRSVLKFFKVPNNVGLQVLLTGGCPLALVAFPGKFVVNLCM